MLFEGILVTSCVIFLHESQVKHFVTLKLFCHISKKSQLQKLLYYCPDSKSLKLGGNQNLLKLENTTQYNVLHMTSFSC